MTAAAAGGIVWAGIGIMVVCALFVAAVTIARKVQERRHREQTRRNLHGR